MLISSSLLVLERNNSFCLIFLFGPQKFNTASLPFCQQSINATEHFDNLAMCYVCLGGTIHWMSQVRLRHMTLQQYLAVSSDGKVYLSDNNRDPWTVFRLHSVIKVTLRIIHLCCQLKKHLLQNQCHPGPILLTC